jgi:hypothetical protein
LTSAFDAKFNAGAEAKVQRSLFSTHYTSWLNENSVAPGT